MALPFSGVCVAQSLFYCVVVFRFCHLAIVFSVHRITISDSSFVVLKLFLFNANLHTQRYIIYLISFALFFIYTFEIMDAYCLTSSKHYLSGEIILLQEETK